LPTDRKTRRACRKFGVFDLVVQIFEMLGTRHQSEGIEKYPGKGSEEVHKTGRGENIDSTTLCTPFEKTGMSSKPWQKRKYPSTRVRKKRRKVQRGGERGK